MASLLVPEDFEIPLTLENDDFRLEPLGPKHNERDHKAWMSSIDHIRNTPGYPDDNWPTPMTLKQNLADLERHAQDFNHRKGFTYSVLDGDDIIGCLYIYPTRKEAYDVEVLSWVIESRAHLDKVLWEAVIDWLHTKWPFRHIQYDPR